MSTRTPPVSRLRNYDLSLPVFKQGSDLASHLEDNVDAKSALEGLAAQYEDAAARCRRLAAVAAECPELRVAGDTHYIGVYGPRERLDPLVEDKLLSVSDADEMASDFQFQLWIALEGEGPFSVEDVLKKLPDYTAFGATWVQEQLDALVEEERLSRTGGKYEIEDDE
jgi:hypothetical protein